MKLPDPNVSPEEIAEQIMLGRELDRHAPLYMLDKLRAIAVIYITVKLKAMGFKQIHPGGDDWRQT